MGRRLPTRLKRALSKNPRRLKACLAALISALVITLVFSIPSGRYDTELILDAIRMVESSGHDNCPDGDGGRAIGPFQIHEPYWIDAVQATPSLKSGHSYQDCRQRSYAEQVVRSYLLRWAPEAWGAGDAEVLARIHNGGPRGHEKDATLGYWAKVQRHLEE